VLFPAHYGQAAGVLRVLTVGALGLITMDMLLKALNAREIAGVAWRVPVALVVEVAALTVLVPIWGIAGAAAAFAAGTWTGAALLGRLYARRHRPPWIRPGTVARYLAALVPLVALLVVAGRLPTLPALGAIVAGLALYATAAVRLRLLREQDMDRLRAITRRLSPRRPAVHR
jgi:O-antigen/teichoic acid export membrane protein